jgi:hypothetical protein
MHVRNAESWELRKLAYIKRYISKHVCGKAVPLYAKQAQRVGGSIALYILNPSARRGWVVSATPQSVSIVEEAG